ncbi:hypothetical protein C5D30_03350 [Rathayibacter toxicus]|uniref:DNA repair protein n=1 Tax=Rathayibacter toxicus TaxID=145458 RepID=A0A2S5Y942_9MICO|nr:hypothetical protein C5D30_03350 [Rathayibacter toxicus]PPI16444.1 hypothetical protein C5C51_03340 [Rathayibacter toxicus]PPI33065.1 hypothetical protein C5D65_03345 [Rathayibacter toxicus]
MPGTRLSDKYEKSGGQPDWDRFADALEASDVAVFGITDYFSADQTLKFIEHFKQRYPASEKLLLVNVELRLNEVVNKDEQMVDFHVIFRDTVTDEEIAAFLLRLQTQITGARGRPKPCSELVGNDYNSATVSRRDIKTAFKDTFGEKAEPTDYLIFIAPANNNGLRAQSGQQRKANLADEIDKDVHAIFGKDVANTTYFLTTSRYEKNQKSKPKPVFGGCDAHSFTDLSHWLGKAVEDESTRQVVTWVKADPTFEGLQQTLVEPGDRVSLSELRPDAKDQYKVIKRVTFEGSKDFPKELVFNPNLNAIIGSRSSGKSALLAHIANAVDPDYTVAQQMLATRLKESEVGPAAGWPWKSVEATACKVEWADGSTEGGQVIYIPQNWLYQISENPREVTNKVRPVLDLHYPTLSREHQRLLLSAKMANEAVDKEVSRWFELADEIAGLDAAIKKIGDKASITKARDGIKAEIEELRTANSLSAKDIENYQTVISALEAKRARSEAINVEADRLAEFVTEPSPRQFTSIPDRVSVETNVSPEPSVLSDELSSTIGSLVAAAEAALISHVEAAVVAYRGKIAKEEDSLADEIAKLESDNKELLEKYKANATLDELVKRQKKQQNSLNRLESLEVRREAVGHNQRESVEQIINQIESRETFFKSLHASFAEETRSLDQLIFGIEVDFDPTMVLSLSEPFRKNATGTFLTKVSDSDVIVDVPKAQGSPTEFLYDLFTKKQKLNQGHSPSDVARRVLTAIPEVRFTATLDQDRIGGFERSTMTPGKQALFALTLILGQAEERWTLLIDQPEDDLDSRSIYGQIVRYLLEQKKQRQIILVTHNANLVVGADAEEVLVANRHGDDRKNRDNRTFDYLTGSLEHSKHPTCEVHDLQRMGVREHAVEILDGGKEAFQKRRDKYKI